MKKSVELTISNPIYTTYHNQGSGGAIISANPSIRNWYLNEVMVLRCDRRFLSNYTTPDLGILYSNWIYNPNIEYHSFEMRYTKNSTNAIIKELLNSGFHVVFDKIDDYYLENKTWYNEKHFLHDGLICGYDDLQKTFTLFAYDKDWKYRKFRIAQKSFTNGRLSALRQGEFGMIYGIKAKLGNVDFEPNTMLKKLKEHLDSTFIKYPLSGFKEVHGNIVHSYLSMYIDKLYDGSIPYERMDWRIFRLLWEHKTVMLERILKTEAITGVCTISDEYKKLVHETNTLRMIYATHHMKRRDSVLPGISKKLLDIKEQEEKLLTEFVEKVEGII